MSGILSEPSMAACKPHSAVSNVKLVSGEQATCFTTTNVLYGHNNHALDLMQVSCGDAQQLHADMRTWSITTCTLRKLGC